MLPKEGIFGHKHIFLATGCSYIIFDFCRTFFRDENGVISRYYVKRPKIKWSEANVDLFEQELLVYQNHFKYNVSGASMNFTVHHGLNDKVYGFMVDADGCEISMPSRILVDSVEKLRVILPDIVYELTNTKITHDDLVDITDEELKEFLADEDVKRFLFLRSIFKGNTLTYTFLPGTVYAILTTLFWPLFIGVSKVSPLAGVIVVPVLVAAIFFTLVKPTLDVSAEITIDRQIFEVGEMYQNAAMKYFKLTRKFGVFLNKFNEVNQKRFSPEGDQVTISVPMKARIYGLETFLEDAKAGKKSRFRMMS